MKFNSIEEFIPLTKSVAKKYAKYGVPFDDLVQEGMLGVIEAKTRFNKNRRTKFTTYATYWIKKKIIDYIQKEKAIKVVDISEYENDISYAETVLTEKEIHISEALPETERQILDLFINKRKTLNEIAEYMGMRREKVRQLKEKAARIFRNKHRIDNSANVLLCNTN